jgi:hypothetical protein
VAKKDMASTISAADRLLETLTDPLHRQIIENYRRHAILEVCGEWEDIFTPDMTVEVPEYYGTPTSTTTCGVSTSRSGGSGLCGGRLLRAAPAVREDVAL